MCGRYAASRDPDDLVEEFEVVARPEEVLEPDYNVAPTKKVYAVLDRRPRGEPEGAVRRELAVVTWGLVPSWAKDRSIGSRLINARMETVAEKPAFRKAFARRRCLLPADGYYEWYTPQDGPRGRGGKPLKQPFFIHPADGGVLAMAGLYELWRDPSREDGDPLAWLMTTTVLTTTAEDAVGMIHDRMPLTVERERWAEWLDPALDGSTTDLTALLVPAAPGRLDAYPVSTDVNNVRNNGPGLLEPLPAEGADEALF
ncbi:MAG: SOS response-associated peptidase [Frankiales bacterium]|nr:SOS response-associated peptidase [Frankiales bacterium]